MLVGSCKMFEEQQLVLRRSFVELLEEHHSQIVVLNFGAMVVELERSRRALIDWLVLCNLASTSAGTGLDCTPGQLVSGRLVLISGEPKQGGERKVPVERFGELRN